MTSTIDMAQPALDSRFTGRLAGLLAAWLPGQRWFGGKGRRIESVTLASCLPVSGGEGDDPRLWHVLADVTYRNAELNEGPQTYQVFVGVRQSLPDRLRHAAIGDPDVADPEVGGFCYDGLHDAELARWLMGGLAGPGGGGPDVADPEVGGFCYDGLHDAELARWLMERLADREGVGPLHFDRLAGHVVRTDLQPLVRTGEQSN